MADQMVLAQRERALAAEILDKIAGDEGFRHQLLDDPRGAMAAAGFADQIESLWSDWMATEEVTGYAALLNQFGPVAESSCLVSLLITQGGRGGTGGIQGTQSFP